MPVGSAEKITHPVESLVPASESGPVAETFTPPSGDVV